MRHLNDVLDLNDVLAAALASWTDDMRGRPIWSGVQRPWIVFK